MREAQAVHVAIVYESLTGHTRKAAQLIADGLTAAGSTATVSPVTDVDYQSLAHADLVVVGGWVDGFFVVGQRPGRAGRLRRLPAVRGKKAIVFCTYALDPGQTLEKMQRIVEERGAEVLGGMAIRRDRLDEGARDLVDRLLDESVVA